MVYAALSRAIAVFALIHTGRCLSLRWPDGSSSPSTRQLDPHGGSSSSPSSTPQPAPLSRHVPALADFEVWLAEREKEDLASQRGDGAANNTGLRVVVGVMTRAGEEDKPYRDAIRKSWMKRPGICAPFDYRPWSAECLVFVSFVVGNSDVQPNEKDMTVLNTAENMNCGKTMVWFRHAALAFPWATHVVKMDMDFYPRFQFLIDQLPNPEVAKCPNYYGGKYILCQSTPENPWPLCPTVHCGAPVGKDFMKYPSTDPSCFVYMQGGFVVLTRPLAFEISRPGGFWETLAANCEPEDATTGSAVHEYALRTGTCVATSHLSGLMHLR